jgi:hypothetical protein
MFKKLINASMMLASGDKDGTVAKAIVSGHVSCRQCHWLYEPALTSTGDRVLVLRGFERGGEAATVQEGRCEMLRSSQRGA